MVRDISFLTSSELVSSLERCNGVIIPVASVEQCGLHGGSGIDVQVALHVAPLLAEACDMLHAPVIPYGDTLEMADWKGTVNVPTSVLQEYYYHVALSFFRAGAKFVLFFCAHSLNGRAVDNACRKLHFDGFNAISCDFWKACGKAGSDILTADYSTGHGAEMISSVSMAISPDLIKKVNKTNDKPLECLTEMHTHFYGNGDVCTMYADFHDYSTSGSWGDISEASSEKGKLLIEKAVKCLAASINEVVAFKTRKKD